MMKNNKWRLIASSIVTLLPMLLGAFAGVLPERIAVHWGISGEADGFMAASEIFLILPPILVAVHWLCLVLSAVLDKNAAQNKKLMEITYWVMPCISLISCGTIFSAALGYTNHIYAWIMGVIGITFIVIGNYMPKTTRNITMGIKVSWALSSNENWQATHRFAGKVYVATGIASLLAIFLPEAAFPYIALCIIFMAAGVPVIYSYCFYRKQLAAGVITKESCEAAYGELVKNKKAALAVTIVMAVVLVIVLPIIMFGGNIETTLEETSLKVHATFWEDLQLQYQDIEAVEYRADGVEGKRIAGYGSANMLLGSFYNDEFGQYIRYTYGADQPCIVLTVGARKIVLGAEDEQQLNAIYERICAEIAQ